MSKSNLNIKSIGAKLKSGVFKSGQYMKSYSEAFLIILFLLMAAFWVLLFWEYAYYVSSTDPQAPPAIFTKVRRTQLDHVVADIAKREQNMSSISMTQAKNIFEDKTITSTSTPALNPGFLPE